MSIKPKIRSLLLICLCVIAVAPFVYSQEKAPPLGTVIENITCLENKQQSYSLYLPAKYSPDKKWPVLYIFDPFARGKVPADIFQAAAEKYSYIIAASNNSKNGLGGQQQNDILTTLWKDTHARFSIDEKRTYAAGLSGGARVANYFAYACKGCIAGVISSGAGFLSNIPVKDGLPYAFFGTIGVDDFNYSELIQVDKTLTEISVPHHIAFFDAGHQWPTPELTFEALEWFDLQAMKSGRMEKNAIFIDRIFSRDKARAEAFVQKENILEAWRSYKSLVDDFTGLADTAESSQKLARLSERKELKEVLKQESEQIKKQSETMGRVKDTEKDLQNDDTKQDALRRLSLEIASLSKISDEKEDSGDRRYARRTLFSIFSYSYEFAMYTDMPKKDYKSAAAKLEVAALVYPKSKNIQIDLARALTLDGRKKEAVEALNRAKDNGFNDCSVLNGEDFTALQTGKDFLKLKTTLGCNN
jgi:hypothetical protein